jgi:hypothetical protein
MTCQFFSGTDRCIKALMHRVRSSSEASTRHNTDVMADTTPRVRANNTWLFLLRVRVLMAPQALTRRSWEVF